MHPIIKRLRNVMHAKHSNLCVAADLTKTTEILNLAETIGEKICILKTHVDIIEDFSLKFTQKLRNIADEKNFLIFEDRKFADIGNTVSLQFSNGVYHISQWADLINAHTIVGPGIIAGLKKVNHRSGLILLAQMTPEGNLFTSEYALKTVEMAKENPDFVIGFIGNGNRPETLNLLRKECGPDFLILTPGINFSVESDGLSQTYNTPEKAVLNGTDIIIVGRGIYKSKDPVAVAEKYRIAGWEAYEEHRRM